MKIKEAQQLLREKKIDILFLLNTSKNRFDLFLAYFSQTSPEHTILAIPAYGQPMLYVAGFERDRIQQQTPLTVKAFPQREIFQELNKRYKPKTIGLHYAQLSVLEFRKIKKTFKAKIVDLSKELRKFRMLKNEEEIEIIRRSCRIASQILDACIKRFSRFTTEQDVKQFLETSTKAFGCEFSFDPIVASGKDAALPHYDGNKKLMPGFCVIDFGVNYKGYCSDITRMVYIGKPPEKEIQAYAKVLMVQEKCKQMIREKAATKKPYEYAYKELGKAFTHSLGHGIGIEIHEFPNLSPKSKEKFQKGMVFTIEPGMYYPGKFGIRIEDDYWINQKGEVEELTSVPKKLICI